MDRKVVPFSPGGSDCLSDPRFRELSVRIGADADSLQVEAVLHLEEGREIEIGFPYPRRDRADLAIASILFQKIGRILASAKGERHGA